MTSSIIIRGVTLGLFFLLAPSLSIAQGNGPVEDIEDVNGLGGGFREVATGLTWLDYSNFFNMSPSQIQQSLNGTGFRLASKAEVQSLFDAVMIVRSQLGTIVPMGSQTSVQTGYYDDSETGSNPNNFGLAGLSSSSTGGSVTDDAAEDEVRSSFGAWVVQVLPTSCESSQASLDFDCDGKDDKIVWRASTGTWFIRLSKDNSLIQEQWGLSGDIPIAGDYDGDGIPDLAVWRASSGTWFIKTSGNLYSSSSAIALQFGLNGDKPLRADFDGDGRLDVSVWRPSDGNFYFVRSLDAQIVVQQFGLSGDIPITAGLGNN